MSNRGSEGELDPQLIREINRELAAYEHARRAPKNERANYLRNIDTIEPPLPIILMENGEHAIARNPMSLHVHLWESYNEDRSKAGFEPLESFVSGQTFRLRANPNPPYVRLDVGINTAPIDLIPPALRLMNNGYVLLAPDCSRLRIPSSQ